MYCRKCFADLSQATGPQCPQCGVPFDPANARTFFKRPFPGKSAIIVQIVGTTVVAVVCAFVVAFFQLTRSSGH